MYNLVETYSQERRRHLPGAPSSAVDRAASPELEPYLSTEPLICLNRTRGLLSFGPLLRHRAEFIWSRPPGAGGGSVDPSAPPGAQGQQSDYRRLPGNLHAEASVRLRSNRLKVGLNDGGVAQPLHQRRRRRIAAPASLRLDFQFNDHQTAAVAHAEQTDFPDTGIRLVLFERCLKVDQTKPPATGQRPESIEVHERDRSVFLEPIAAARG